MASDQVVTAQDMLRAVILLRRRGARRVLQAMEQEEPDLTEYLLEELSNVQRDLLDLGARPAKARRLAERAEAVGLVLVLALRQAHLRLWQRESADGPLASLADDGGGPPETPPPDEPPGPAGT